MSKIAGIDVGGTFTDLILVDDVTGEVKLAKVPTTVDNQAFGVLAALDATGADAAGLAAIIHGTTTTTNAMLERKIAKVGLITTRGFRDVLELGRRTRPKAYGMTGTFVPLIPRELRFEVAERMDAEGNVLTPLDEAAVEAAARALMAAGAEAVVIHFLHSYINPAHELRAAALLKPLWHNAFVTIGHTIVAEYREYERGVTAAVNAAVQPVLARYIARLQTELKGRGFAKDLLVMQGNGGTVSSSIVAERAVNTVMSGPASGVIAAAYTGVACGVPNLITYDMGGTSSDVALIKDGLPSVSSELELEYAMPIHVPMIDVHTIGAGGGSLASVDAAGMLRVGPESAGASPGPICYARGGVLPTITDANLVLGRLNPDKLLSVPNPLPVARVRALLVEHVGSQLGLDATQTAAAILRIANDKMAGAIRMVSLARGHDPRDFALFAFGGAGPLHACALARELGIPTVLIPSRPGLTNALGCTVADVRHDYVRTVNQPLKSLDEGLMAHVFAEQEAQGRATIAREKVEVERIDCVLSADMQFQGQSHLLNVAVPAAAISLTQLQVAFETAYWQRFGVELKEIRPVLVNLSTAVIGKRRAVDLKAIAAAQPRAALSEAQIGTRPVWFAGADGMAGALTGGQARAQDSSAGAYVETPVYQREWLPAGARFTGPAIIEQLDCTTVIDPGAQVELDAFGNLIATL